LTNIAADKKKAVEWYHKAAEQRNAEAQFCLGICFAAGEGVSKDARESVDWFFKAARQNHKGAMDKLTKMGYEWNDAEEDEELEEEENDDDDELD
jgi:TPR repeat protein